MYTLIMEQYDNRIKIHKMDIPKIELNNGVRIPCIGNGPGIVGYLQGKIVFLILYLNGRFESS